MTRDLDGYAAIIGAMDVVEYAGRHPEEQRRRSVRAFPAASDDHSWVYLFYTVRTAHELEVLRLQLVAAVPGTSHRPDIPPEAWDIAETRLRGEG